ncbi:hypothetical protein TanjilG_10666 [Lupinus angustifolius]|uniref:Autophagy-related protein 9 n=1 Tax=Lupinus angustifolius TaxID=3871 RepID=A0A394DPW2_LUPAN|nr:hypothetical protein TanjilG_10666 [Lupinus angustifolius]
MFSRPRDSSAFSIFKWKRQDESSVTTGLLQDVLPEIELSDYRRIPSPGSESPSGLLNGESLNAEPIPDLDLFFERLYSYYCEKGLCCIIIKWIVELLSLGFTICFSGFFLLYVDWNGLRNAKCGINAVESGIKPCDLAKEALHQYPLTPLTLNKAIIVGYLGIFSIYWIFCFLRFFSQLKYTLEIRQFYYNSLHVTDNEIQTMPWATVIEKVVRVQSSQQLCVVKDLSAHDMVMRLMRKENYLIGMINKGVLAFPISQWVPGSGPTVKSGPNGTQYRLILTKTLEWTLNWCILQSMFDRNFCVRTDFVSNPRTLKKRLMIVGLAMLLLSPFLVIFMLVYLFLTHAEQFYNHPSTASSRRWSNLSSRAVIKDELLVLDPEGAMSMVVQHTHYMPKRWRGKESTENVRIEFETLFQRVDDILQFIADFTVNVEGVGHVCSFSSFDFQEHGNSDYGSPFNAPYNRRSSQGKLEKSFLSFRSSYPTWQSNARAKQFLLNLRTFREQKLPGYVNRYAYSPPRMWRGSPNMGNNGDRNRFASREMLPGTFETGNDLDSLWLIEASQNNHPYLLDWYYTSRPHDLTFREVPIPNDPFDVTEHYPRDWMPSNLTKNEPGYAEYLNEYPDDRAASHLGASTSAPIFRESLMEDHNSNDLPHTIKSHWWARSHHQQGVPGQTSFFEPPDFNQQTTAYNNYDKFSDRGSEGNHDQEQHLYWRDRHDLSRTAYTDDLEAGEINLHFDDIYSSRPPENPTVYSSTASF